jgi:hypothetical protein
MDLIRHMLCLDQEQRWTARQLLGHPWITLGDEELEKRDLTGSLTELKRYNARRKLRAAADAVIVANRIRKMTGRLSPLTLSLTIAGFGSSKVIEVEPDSAAEENVSSPDTPDIPAAQILATSSSEPK